MFVGGVEHRVEFGQRALVLADVEGGGEQLFAQVRRALGVLPQIGQPNRLPKQRDFFGAIGGFGTLDQLVNLLFPVLIIRGGHDVYSPFALGLVTPTTLSISALKPVLSRFNSRDDNG
jgi:hypothetical protein